MMSMRPPACFKSKEEQNTSRKEAHTMSTNGNGQFLESELIHRKVKVGNEWQTRTFPVVGGRLRLAHEQNDSLSLQPKWSIGMVSTPSSNAVLSPAKGSTSVTAPPTAKGMPSLLTHLSNWRKREASQEP